MLVRGDSIMCFWSAITSKNVSCTLGKSEMYRTRLHLDDWSGFCDLRNVQYQGKNCRNFFVCGRWVSSKTCMRHSNMGLFIFSENTNFSEQQHRTATHFRCKWKLIIHFLLCKCICIDCRLATFQGYWNWVFLTVFIAGSFFKVLYTKVRISAFNGFFSGSLFSHKSIVLHEQFWVHHLDSSLIAFARAHLKLRILC